VTDSATIEQRTINTIRFLAADAVQKANSGHPGLPMGAAGMAYVLWTRHLKHNPANPQWADRDRFVLSAGHGSMLLYALLHLTGYHLSLDDIKAFRQWGSKTPGHPESFCTPGVESTTGPLGQGISNAVGMALTEAHLAARFNRPGYRIVDHHTYVLASDGDLMEGVAAEAASLAGHLQLGKLIVLFDDNRISLAGSTALTFTEDVAARFESYGWHVLRVAEGNDLVALDAAIEAARAESARPSLILVRTTIGYGAPSKEGTFYAHGAPLGEDEVRAAKERLGWPTDTAFHVPDDVKKHMRQALDQGQQQQASWEALVARYESTYPDLAAEFRRRVAGVLPEGWDEGLSLPPLESPSFAPRKISESTLQNLAQRMPELTGGSADLNPSCRTWLKGFGDFQPAGTQAKGVQGAVGAAWDYAGRNVHFGVREHAMGAIVNGMALHGGVRSYASTFFIFSDYMRPPIRLAALMSLPVVYVFTHDSIGVGEDGPTHQPIEQLMNLRAIPNLDVIRPADPAEIVEAWRAALGNLEQPTAIILTRQNLPLIDRTETASAEGLHRGAYILWESGEGLPDVILIGTGSELHLALLAGKELAAEGIHIRVVSMPSWELFDRQKAEYRDSVLPEAVRARVAVEAGIKLGWEHFVGLDGAVVGMETFGASAPGSVLYRKFGITVEQILNQAKDLIGK
jgi:transketolase